MKSDEIGILRNEVARLEEELQEKIRVGREIRTAPTNGGFVETRRTTDHSEGGRTKGVG